ncbi:hypothetical protein JOC95_001308 [Bacillus tianshenii]|uniref:Uncharacterized protein n=1 Tax=Sutcliffiella tianshenii TaxID=1463404 RepID=A0ABS2NXV7_9BACI|nr:hypothetical protein [Bacillus tianshenii]MBM7619459.1 hypothetical protein [Bacillus tianshenii]
MLRTTFGNQEVILRIKPNISRYTLNDELIYEVLQKAMGTIFHLENFVLNVEGKYLIIGDTQQSAYPLITVLQIVPIRNMVTL